MDSLDETMPSTERPGANGAVPKTPTELRYEGLAELFGAVEEAIEGLGNEVSETKIAVKEVFSLCQQLANQQAETQASQKLLLESNHRMSEMLTELRDRSRAGVPESVPVNLGDRTSERQ